MAITKIDENTAEETIVKQYNKDLLLKKKAYYQGELDKINAILQIFNTD